MLKISTKIPKCHCLTAYPSEKFNQPDRPVYVKAWKAKFKNCYLVIVHFAVTYYVVDTFKPRRRNSAASSFVLLSWIAFIRFWYSEPYNGRDREGLTLHNGDIKYFRAWNGYLYRGRIYHNINNMWWVIVDKYTVRNVAAFNLFDLAPDDKRGRLAKAKSYLPPFRFSMTIF